MEQLINEGTETTLDAVQECFRQACNLVGGRHVMMRQSQALQGLYN